MSYFFISKISCNCISCLQFQTSFVLIVSEAHSSPCLKSIPLLFSRDTFKKLKYINLRAVLTFVCFDYSDCIIVRSFGKTLRSNAIFGRRIIIIWSVTINTLYKVVLLIIVSFVTFAWILR